MIGWLRGLMSSGCGSSSTRCSRTLPIKHPWFGRAARVADNARADWYVWADAKPDGSPPYNWLSVFGGPAWAWDARRGQYYLHNFLTEQPDLNVHNPAVQDALLECGRFWLERGVDGFRVDAIDYAMHDPQLTDNPPAIPNGKHAHAACGFPGGPVQQVTC